MKISKKRSTSLPSSGLCGSSVIPECFCRESIVRKTLLSRAAFTLVELVITIAIVIILSVISVPIYRGYVDKAKYSEGYALLGQILTAQKNYFSEYGNFIYTRESSAGNASFTSNDEILGVDARGNQYFKSFNIGDTDGSGYENLKYHIYILVTKPEELVKNGKTLMEIYYNITTGSVFKDDINYSASEFKI